MLNSCDISMTEKLIEEFYNNAKNSKYIFLQISGVKYKEIEGQRPLRLANEALKECIPTIYAYLRPPTDPIEIMVNDSGLIVMPFDVFSQLKEKILEKSAKNIGGPKKIMLIHVPHRFCIDIIPDAKTAGWFVIYDCMDLYKDFKPLGQAYWFSEYVEAYIAKNADLVVVTNENLGKYLMRYGIKKYVVVPNGVDPSRLNRELEPYELPKGDINIGFFGYITSAWFDWDVLLFTLAKRHKNWMFHIIGWGEEWPKNVPDNIISIGPVPHVELPHYTASWDVGLLNFKNTFLVRCSCPIKVYEYLWLGLPVVSVDIPYLRNYPYVYTCSSVDDYERNIILASKQKVNRKIVDDFLSKYTWNYHLHTILDKVNEHE